MEKTLSIIFLIGVFLIGGLVTHDYRERLKKDKESKSVATNEIKVDEKQNKVSNVVVKN